MQHFTHNNQEWFIEEIALNDIAKQLGTPCYVYSKTAIIDAWHEFDRAFNGYPHQINYAVKANSNLSILNIFNKLNSGFDIVSAGELVRVLATGCPADQIIFSGAGKLEAELLAALQAGIGCFNIESQAELLRLNQIALELRVIANIAVRVNPDIDPKSHPYISTGIKAAKFGVGVAVAKELYLLAKSMPAIKITGIAFHIGSQINCLDPFLAAIDKTMELVNYLQQNNIFIEYINIGGGLGVSYKQTDHFPSITAYVQAVVKKLSKTNLPIYIEPGRALVANAGVLLTKVEYIKKMQDTDRYFAIVDAAMNDLLRPALYDAWHDITTVKIDPYNSQQMQLYDIVGPVCESADFLGKNRSLAITENNLLMVKTTGAYSSSMSSNYNSRPKPAEVLVENNKFYIIRHRENINNLFKLEVMI